MKSNYVVFHRVFLSEGFVTARTLERTFPGVYQHVFLYTLTGCESSMTYIATKIILVYSPASTGRTFGINDMRLGSHNVCFAWNTSKTKLYLSIESVKMLLHKLNYLNLNKLTCTC